MTTRPPLSLRHGLLVAAVTAAVALPTFRVAAPPKARQTPPSATTRATGLSERTDDSRDAHSLAPSTTSTSRVSRGTVRPFLPPSTRPATPRITTGVWDRLAQCESGQRWNANTGNGYFGGLQMDMAFWRSYGGPAFAPRPDLASRSQQIVVAERARDSGRGYSPWPVCSRKAGLR